MVDNQVQDRRWLKEIRPARPLAGSRSHAIDQIGLNAEQFRVQRDNEAGFPILHRP